MSVCWCPNALSVVLKLIEVSSPFCIPEVFKSYRIFSYRELIFEGLANILSWDSLIEKFGMVPLVIIVVICFDSLFVVATSYHFYL